MGPLEARMYLDDFAILWKLLPGNAAVGSVKY